MKLFKCQSCQQILYFENTVCVKSGHRLGYIPEMATLSALIATAIHGGRSRRRAVLPVLRKCGARGV